MKVRPTTLLVVTGAGDRLDRPAKSHELWVLTSQHPVKRWMFLRVR